MILAVLQARMSSSRFPGKVLRPLLGEPMLFRQIERVRRAGSIDELVVATSSDFFLASVRVTIGSAQARGTALLTRGPAGWPAVEWRKYL